MLNKQNAFNNIHGNQVDTNKFPMKVAHENYQRESHGLERGIRKDKKIKMNRKFT